jgi:hypothetical protein
MLTASFYWFLSGVLLSALSTCFLLDDLKNRRTYLIVGVEDTAQRKVVIGHDRSPLLFQIIVVGVALCTAVTLVICLGALLVSRAASAGLLEAMDSWQVVLAFTPYSLVLMYVLGSISGRILTRWWDTEAEGPQTLGISHSSKKDEADD